MPSALPRIVVLNGPNLNLLGLRQPELYGHVTLDEVEQLCIDAAEALDLQVDFRQSNLEGELVGWIQECRGRAAGLVVNAAGYTMTSVAILDALLTLDVPIVEVHLTNMQRREAFRHHSYVAQAATGTIAGLGAQGYALAIQAIASLLDEKDRHRP